MIGFENDPRLLDEHAVAVREETISLVDGVVIGAQSTFGSGESADQHEQARLRQMKVGEKSVHDAELKTGIDEDVGVAAVLAEGIALLRRELESAERSGAHRNDATLLRASAI
jgi:hypothetical protein